MESLKSLLVGHETYMDSELRTLYREIKAKDKKIKKDKKELKQLMNKIKEQDKKT